MADLGAADLGRTRVADQGWWRVAGIECVADIVWRTYGAADLVLEQKGMSVYKYVRISCSRVV